MAGENDREIIREYITELDPLNQVGGPAGPVKDQADRPIRQMQ